MCKTEQTRMCKHTVDGTVHWFVLREQHYFTVVRDWEREGIAWRIGGNTVTAIRRGRPARMKASVTIMEFSDVRGAILMSLNN